MKTALVLGGAECVWTDVEAFETLIGRRWDGTVIAVNDVGAHWPRRLDHWVTEHAEFFDRWRALRRELGHPDGYMTWSSKNSPEIDHWVQSLGGSSGLLAVQVATEGLGMQAVLCGIPMTATPHFAESRQHEPGKRWGSVEGHWKRWTKFADRFTTRVRSMSGRTQDMFGAPDPAWLEDTHAEAA